MMRTIVGCSSSSLLRATFRCLFYSLLLALAFFVPTADSKLVSGDFKLSGVNTEKVLTFFAVLPTGGKLYITLTSQQPYANENNLKFRLYRDDKWPRFLKAQTCVDKTPHAKHSYDVSFAYNEELGKYKAELNVLLMDNPGKDFRPHYWYFVLDDCSLEQYLQDGKIPLIHFDLDIWNYVPYTQKLTGDAMPVTHLSADEQHLTLLHTVTLIWSGLLAFLLFMNATISLATSKKTVHVAVLWVATAAAFDAASSLAEIIHVSAYRLNGTGSYLMDAVAAHAEAVCDAAIMILLITIAAGWTLPSDIMTVNTSSGQGHLQRLLQDFARPVSSLQHFNAAGMLSVTILLSHVILAQWGRTYNENFESYHDYEHLPGKILMLQRILAGFLFLAATLQTRLKCNNRQLQAFYLKLAVAGFGWFQSLPILTWICNNAVPYYLRHPAVFIGSAVLQSASITLLAWLVTTTRSAYHQVSHITTPKEDSLTDQLHPSSNHNGSNSRNGSASRSWKLGKAKVRLD